MINFHTIRKTLITLIVVVAHLSGISQSVKKVNTLQQLAYSIDALVKQNHIPGLIVGITSKDTTLYSGTFGYADVNRKLAVNHETLFRMGSITKSLIAIAILKLVEQRKLSLNDHLRNIAPEVPFINQWETSNPVRIADLLEQLTGFDDFKFRNMYTLKHEAYSTTEMMLRQRPSMITRWRPGERYTYCNVNYVILGYVIKKLTEQEYDQYLTLHVLRPLHMMQSDFSLWRPDMQRYAKEYNVSTSGMMGEVPSVTLIPGAAGSLWSNTDDMLKLVRFYLKDGQQVLSSKSVHRMETPANSLAAKAGLSSGYALGNEDFGQYRGHDGMLGTFRSCYRYNRSSGLGFVIASSAGGIGGVEELVRHYLAQYDHANTKIAGMPLNLKEINPYLGYYRAKDSRFKLLSLIDELMVIKIDTNQHQLFFSMLGKVHPLVQTSPLLFMQPGCAYPTMAFTINQDGKRVLIFNKHYCEKIPAATAILFPVLLLFSVILTMLAVVTGLVSLGKAAFKGINKATFMLYILPMLSAMCLIWGGCCFAGVNSNNYLLYQLSSVTWRSLSILTGFTLSSVLALLAFFAWIKFYNRVASLYLRIYLFSTATSLLVINGLLAVYGWVGLCTWLQ